MFVITLCVYPQQFLRVQCVPHREHEFLQLQEIFLWPLHLPHRENFHTNVGQPAYR